MSFEITNHVAIQVKNLSQAADFYKNFMGMTILNHHNNEVVIKCGDIVFHAEEGSKEQTFFDFKVQDLEASKQKLQLAGCNITETYCDQGKSYLVSDPFGMKFHMYQERSE